MPHDRTLPFTPEEYASRLERVRRAMSDIGADILVATDPANMFWLTGYDAWSFYSHQAVVIPLEATPLWWGRELDVAGARLTTWLPDDRVVGFPEHHVQAADHHPYTDLAALLVDEGLATGVVAVEMDAIGYTAAAHQALSEAIPETGLADGTGLVNRCRAVKSPAEADYMRAAGRIVDTTHARIAEIVEPGLPRHLLAAEITRLSIDAVDDIAGDYPAIVPLMPTGDEAVAPHLTWDDRPFVTGDTTFIEIAGCVRRYHAPCSRSYHLGEASPALREAEAAVLEAHAAGLDAALPGQTANAVAAAVFGTLATHGFDREGRCGYPVGAAYPPDWGERTFSLRDDDQTVLEPGMTFHLMPVLWVAGIAMGATDTIIITDSGPAEAFTSASRPLTVVGD